MPSKKLTFWVVSSFETFQRIVIFDNRCGKLIIFTIESEATKFFLLVNSHTLISISYPLETIKSFPMISYH